MSYSLLHKKIIFSIVLLIALLFQRLNAQQIEANAQLDTSIIKIGEQAKLKLSIKYRLDNGKYVKVKFPEIADTIRKEIEVVQQSKIDTIIDNNDPYSFMLTRTIYLTSFDSGYWAIPPFRFNVNDDTNGVFTSALLLQVGTVDVDTTQAIKDIKPPFEQTYSFIDWIKDNMNVVYAILITIVLVIVIIYLSKKLKNTAPEVKIELPPIPAHIIAFEKLEKLKEQKLWQEGKLKLYHSALTDILREYIENRFKIQALEQTTDEILFGFRNVAVDEESKAKLKSTLLLADLVKFAKEQPLANENELSLSNVYDFINGTKKEDDINA